MTSNLIQYDGPCLLCKSWRTFYFNKNKNAYICSVCKKYEVIPTQKNQDLNLEKEALRQAILEFDAKNNDSDVSRSFCDDCRYFHGWDMPTLLKTSLECDECKKLNVNLDERKKSENSMSLDFSDEFLQQLSINHPSHYQSEKMEVIDVIEAFQLNFLTGNVIKYLLRAGKKGQALEDFKKARWYLERVIASYND